MGNTIVLQDAMSSRNHCEVFVAGQDWVVRDQNSRNGTMVNGALISSDRVLRPGDIIQIGSTELGFTLNPDPSPTELTPVLPTDDTSPGLRSKVQPAAPQPPIVERLSKPARYDSPAPDDPDAGRVARALSQLYRLALEMGSASTIQELTEKVLQVLFNETKASIGAVLLLPQSEWRAQARMVDSAGGDDTTFRLAVPERLEIAAYRNVDEQPYQRVSDHLTSVVIRSHEAVLAFDDQNDSVMQSDSMHEIDATSVICAPLRVGAGLLGVIHLYSNAPHIRLDREALEYTLAVADQFAIGLYNLHEKQSLASGLARVKTQNRNLREQLELDSELVGESGPMRKLRADIEQIAPSDATVLIRGESGVGKELVARAIHFKSHRKDGPFVCLNCAALSETLLESELFGHEKGSFTGATERKSGKFEQAHGGTLFLDEVGEMGSNLQAKFLRALEGHPFERVGGHTPIRVDTRVVAATNRDLEDAVKEGTFRKDLYFRLQVVEIQVPPLRDRQTDIPVLANFFLDRFRKRQNRAIQGFTDEALDALLNYHWPGNIRELQNTIERTVILCTEPWIRKTDIRLSPLSEVSLPAETSATPCPREISLEKLEREHILSTLEATAWNKSKAAQILGIERSTLDRKLKRYKVSRPQN